MRSNSQHKRFFRLIYSALILGGLVFIFGYFWYEYLNQIMQTPFQNKGNLLMIFVYGILAFVFINFMDGYRIGYHKRGTIIFGQFIGIFLTIIVLYIQLILMIGTLDSTVIIIKYIIYVFVFSLIYSILLTIISSLIYLSVFSPQKIFLLYEDKHPKQFIEKMQSRSDKFQLEDYMSINEGFENVKKEVLKHNAVLVYDIKSGNRNKILKFCCENYISVYFTPKISDIIVGSSNKIFLFDEPLLLAQEMGLTIGQRFTKRIFDIIMSIIGILIGLPFMVIIGVFIKTYDGGPIFYTQERVSLRGKKFNIIKFRSMIVNAEKDGKSIPAKNNDVRITPIGKVIRKIRVDELPQLFNILMGKMSIVGPRPERVEHVEKYTKVIPEFRLRLAVKGGLTGYAQIYGKYNTNAYDKLRMDLEYIQNYSFLLDLKILLATIKTIFEKTSTEGFKNNQEKKTKEDSNNENLDN